ncbi:hypothetical protein LTR40_009333 [Exophiala xenobiotica]|nr:hypothetical protein LTR40_009333 [Exophiala xenobiotica]
MFVLLPRGGIPLLPVSLFGLPISRLLSVHFHEFRNCETYQKLTTPGSETKQKTLEEVAAAFGDKVVLVTENEIAVEDAVMQDKAGMMQVESTQGKPAVA